MALDRKGTGKASKIPVGLAMGLGLSMGITLLGAATAAWMVLKEWLQEGSMGAAVTVVHFLASAAGAWLAMHKTKGRKLQVCMLTGLSYYLLLLAVTALFFDGLYQGMGPAAIAVLAGSAAVALVGARGKKGSVSRRKKRAYR